MFQRLYDLSRSLSVSEKAPWQRINEGMPPEYNRGFALCFSTKGEWLGVKTTYNSEGIIYRSGPSNGTDCTPCCKLASNTANRLLKAVKALASYDGLALDKKQWLQASIQCFENRKEEIWQSVETKIKSEALDKDKRGFVYWVIDSVPVYEWAKAFLEQQFLAAFAKGGTRIGTCSVCGQQGLEVYGNVSIVACYNLDKRGSIAGGFMEKQAHRNFPVCQHCAFSVAEAFSFAENHLTSKMAGQDYIVLPYTSTPKVQNKLRQILSKNPQRYSLGKCKDLVAQETRLVRQFKELAFALIFFKAKNNEWRLQAEVQQLLPSRMRELHEAGQEIFKADDLATESKGEEKPLQITANTFKIFSSCSKKESGDTLRAWLIALFEGHFIDYNHFIRHLVNKIVSTGKDNPNKLNWVTRQAWGLYRYAIKTQLLEQTKGEENMPKAEIDSPYAEYIKAHSDFFSRQEIVTAFLTGCYASTVASVQYKERNATPFTKKFIGRLLSREQLQNIYREGHAKLTQYRKLAYVIQKDGKGLDPDLASAWVACGEQWNISDEEATFAFTIGYSLAYRIYKLSNLDLPLEDEQ